MFNYLIVGTGDYAKMLRRYLNNTMDVDILAFTVKNEQLTEKELDGKRIIQAADLQDYYNSENTKLIMGIGYREMNQIKQRQYNIYKEMGYSFDNYIHPTAIIDSSVKMGEGNNIFEGVIIQEGVRIGNSNLIYGGSLVAHESNVGDFNSLSVKVCVAGCSTIGNNCFIGANATIRDHIFIKDFSLVGAGAYVDSSTEEYNVVVPNKSVVLANRSSLEFL